MTMATCGDPVGIEGHKKVVAAVRISACAPPNGIENTRQRWDRSWLVDGVYSLSGVTELDATEQRMLLGIMAAQLEYRSGSRRQRNQQPMGT